VRCKEFDMKAAVVEEIGKPLVVHRDWPDPECGADEAVIRVEANGICRSDHHVWQGGWPWVGIAIPAPIVLGHEYCGVVEQVGARVSRFKRGDRVVVPFNHSCGKCEPCASGHQNVCADLNLPMLHYGGGFGRYAKVARADVNLVLLPGGVSFVDAAGMGCRFMTSWHGVVDQAHVQAGEWVAVFGCGGVGLAAVDIAVALGANVIAVSRTPAKLELAKELGAAHVIGASAGGGVAEQVAELTGGGAHVSIDAVGDAETTLPAIQCLRVRGRHLRLGTSSKKQAGAIALPVDLIVFRELEMIGSFGMQAARYPAMLRMVEAGKLHPGKLVTGTVSIERAGGVLDRMSSFDTVGMQVITQW
jgi:D-arabinose 1-dehydrogenase-like Zn-dependent alcohol dehydrogenase